MVDLLGLTRADLTALVGEWGFSPFHADAVWRSLYGRTRPSDRPIRKDLAARLEAETIAEPLPVIRTAKSVDGETVKHLVSLGDGEAVEAVLMRYPAREGGSAGRYTACVSTQAGCAMGCVFCATGQMGFRRHLTAGEIVGQVRLVSRTLAERTALDQAFGSLRLRNLVMMGMGEPLHNYDATMQALAIVSDPLGLGLAPRHITISTVGLPGPIRRLADEGRPYRLAVSLHATTDEERLALVPTVGKLSLAELIDACRYYARVRRRRIFFEWTLIDDVNDSPEQARALGHLLRGIDAHVNLIPLNPTGGFTGRPSTKATAQRFQEVLAAQGLPSTVRQRRGVDIAAGCGQLRQAAEGATKKAPQEFMG
ncbi:MAG: dual-specificity RNA methyltransferase RlmN [Planctomycetota bacterium]|jgi:23S rRNA (adenine2503-C2)-methyltransferase